MIRTLLNLLPAHFSSLLSFIIVIGITTSAPLYAEKPKLYQRALTKIDKLTPKKLDPVDLKTQSRRDFKKYVDRQISRSFANRKLQSIEKIYRHLGLLPESYPLRKKLSELYSVQAGAYYDPKKQTINRLEGDLPEGSRFFMYLHELVHAYQDQHYDLSAKQKSVVNKSFDAKMALTFLIEGHANLIATLSLIVEPPLDKKYFRSGTHRGLFDLMARFTNFAPEGFSSVGEISGSSMMVEQVKQLENVPDSLIHQMLDPYLVGQRLWYDHFADAGWPDGENWLKNSPQSTRQILYETRNIEPEKFESLPRNPTSKYSNSLGLYVLLRWLGALNTRPQWGKNLVGDRAELIDTGKDNFLAWTFRFNSEDGARNFIDLIVKKSAANNGGADQGPFVLGTAAGPRYVKIQKQGHLVRTMINADTNIETYQRYLSPLR